MEACARVRSIELSDIASTCSSVGAFCTLRCRIIRYSLSALLTVPINTLIQHLLGADTLTAALSPVQAGILVGISMIITVIGGLLPARRAAKKDPVIVLRTE